MRKTITFLFITMYISLNAQTLTYATFSANLTSTLNVNIADNTSYTSTLSTTTGSNVVWNASGLIQQSGTPTVHLSYHSPMATPNGSLFPSSNFCEYDPALVSVLEYNYYGINNDSIVSWGSYAPSGEHEIYQNPDKDMIFPFSYGQSFTDSYAKTNYSDATTVSSYQNGTRTVNFAGIGTLILPQGSVNNVAFITEVRTNNLGPNSYEYNWIQVNTHKRLLYRSENNGNITTVWNPDVVTGVEEEDTQMLVHLFPNPSSEKVTLILSKQTHILKLELVDLLGKNHNVYYDMIANEASIHVKDLPNGIYTIKLETTQGQTTKKFIKQ
ncbi:MAG: T9SS type A sorting domain-containing protein [Bacteroidia bacterium]|nr:T9SS type A sorting domain-containing protein [Bacteroidia bacterium]